MNEAEAKIEGPIGVLGVGVEGRATIQYLLSHGVNEITALDAKLVEDLPPEVETVFGEGYDRNLDRFDTIFKSPGIRPDNPEIEKARESGAHVTSALSFFMERCPCPVVGVTGTVGKGTTCSLIDAALREAGFTVHLGGNIGRNSMEFLDIVKEDHRVVLEISSFQAMDVSTSPDVAVILKTTSEHLDWHRDTTEYMAAKARLLVHQDEDDTVIFNRDCIGSIEIARNSLGKALEFSIAGEVDRGIFVCDGGMFLRLGDSKERLPIDINKVCLPGRFNLSNVAAGVLAAICVRGDPGSVCRAAQNFGSLPHRLELAAHGGNVRYYNDSYATRPEAAVAALTVFDEKLALIAGGSEKNADFQELFQAILVKSNLVHVSLIGATASRLEEGLRVARQTGFLLERFEDLESAMEAGSASLQGEGVLLMSPACASFGMFPNYKVRGECFRAKAVALAKDQIIKE